MIIAMLKGALRFFISAEDANVIANWISKATNGVSIEYNPTTDSITLTKKVVKND